MFREDYILRLIQQLVDAIARIAGFNRRGEHDKALAEAEQAWGKLIDAPPELVRAVDSATLAEMLRTPEKMRLAVQLLHEEGRALAGTGDPLHAAVRYRRAMELLLEARAHERRSREDQDDEREREALERRSREDQDDEREREALERRDDDTATLMELSRLVPAHTLDPRYRGRV